MKLQGILLEQKQQKISNRKMMLEESANFWTELEKVYNLPLTESARGDEYKRLEGELYRVALQLPLDQIDEFQKVFSMGINQDGLQKLSESVRLDEIEIIGKIKDAWNALTKIVKNAPKALFKLGVKMIQAVGNTVKGMITGVKDVISKVVDGLKNLENSLMTNESTYDDFFDRLEKEIEVLTEADLMNEDLAGDIIKPHLDKISAEFPTIPFEQKVAKVIALVKQTDGDIDGLFVSRIVKETQLKTGATTEYDLGNVSGVRQFVADVGLRKLIKAEMKELTGDSGEVDADNEYDALHSPEMADRIKTRMFRDKDYVEACKKLGLDYTEPENSFMVAVKKQKWSILLGMVSVGMAVFNGVSNPIGLASLLASTLLPLGLQTLAEYGEAEGWDIKTVERLKTIAKWSKRIGMIISISNIAYQGWTAFANWKAEKAAELAQAKLDAVQTGNDVYSGAVADVAAAKIQAANMALGGEAGVTKAAELLGVKVQALQNMDAKSLEMVANVVKDGNVGPAELETLKTMGVIKADMLKTAVDTKVNMANAAVDAKTQTVTNTVADTTQQAVQAKANILSNGFNADNLTNISKVTGIDTDTLELMTPQNAAKVKEFMTMTSGGTDTALSDLVMLKKDLIANNPGLDLSNLDKIAGFDKVASTTGMSPDKLMSLGDKNLEVVSDFMSNHANGVAKADDLIALKQQLLANNPKLDLPGLDGLTKGLADAAASGTNPEIAKGLEQFKNPIKIDPMNPNAAATADAIKAKADFIDNAQQAAGKKIEYLNAHRDDLIMQGKDVDALIKAQENIVKQTAEMSNSLEATKVALETAKANAETLKGVTETLGADTANGHALKAIQKGGNMSEYIQKTDAGDKLAKLAKLKKEMADAMQGNTGPTNVAGVETNVRSIEEISKQMKSISDSLPSNAELHQQIADRFREDIGGGMFNNSSLGELTKELYPNAGNQEAIKNTLMKAFNATGENKAAVDDLISKYILGEIKPSEMTKALNGVISKVNAASATA